MSEFDEALVTAYGIALKSPDPSTQNGAVLINYHKDMLAIACNAFPWKVLETPERWERPEKYYFVEHAERNVIFHAAQAGVPTAGLTMVCPWAACADCARAIIQSGITTLVRHKLANGPKSDSWQQSIVAGDTMMTEAGVNIIEVDPIPGWKLRRNGEIRDTGEL